MTTKKKAGRPPKPDRAQHCVMVRFTPHEYADLLALIERAGAKHKAVFIKKLIFGRDFSVLKADLNTLGFYDTLKELRIECRKIGVNYNQYITILRGHFTEQRAAMMSNKSAELLQQVVMLNEKALHLTLKLVRQWLPK
ncbi:MAG: hypothetical protein SNI70_07825 [Rikenellaceae bacterium]